METALWIAGIVSAFLMLRRWIASTRRTAAAFNVLLGKYTYLTLSPETKSRVEARAKQILFMASDAHLFEFNGEIDMYGWYALAMNELGIPPAVQEYPSWNIVRNPITALLPNDPTLANVARYIKSRFGVDISVSHEDKFFDSLRDALNRKKPIHDRSSPE